LNAKRSTTGNKKKTKPIKNRAKPTDGNATLNAIKIKINPDINKIIPAIFIMSTATLVLLDKLL
jgi:hypothetical protein